MTYIDDFGMEVGFGLGEGRELKNRTDVSENYIHEIVTDIDYDAYGLPSANAGSGFGRGIAKIPANSVIDEVKLFITSAAATPATTINVGVSEKDGTAIDADGLAAAATTGVGLQLGEGALVKASVGAEDGYITITSEGTAAALAGLKGKLIVTFL